MHIIDLRVPLLDYKANSGDSLLLYHKTDTHWNLLGGHLAYTYLIDELKTYYPELTALETEKLAYEIIHENGGQGLSNMMGLEDAYQETYPHYTIPLSCAEEIEYTGSLLPKVGLETHFATNEINAVFFHDSFFRRIRPFFSESFGTTIYFNHTRFIPWIDESDMDTFLGYAHSQIIIEEMVERTIPVPSN